MHLVLRNGASSNELVCTLNIGFGIETAFRSLNVTKSLKIK